jgi:hypothetical protein
MALRIEIRKNFRGLWDLREGDLDGFVECSNMTYTDLIKEIERELRALEAPIPPQPKGRGILGD